MKFRIKQWIKMFVQQVALPFVYWLNRLRKVNPDYVIFADAHHKERPESMHRLYQMLRNADYEIREMYSDYSSLGMFGLVKEMFRFMKEYAMAGTVVICDNFLPVTACNKKKDTKVVQLWHGAGAFKRFGYDAKDDIPSYYKGQVYKNYDLVTVSSPWCVKPFASAMHLEEEVVQPMGVSRMDAYFEEDYKAGCRDTFYYLYPEARGKKILLWAPTFRGNAANPILLGLEEMQELERQLGEDWYVIYSIHPHLVAHLTLEGCCSELSTEQLIPVADVFVTDYSSVLFDAVILNAKVLLYAPDLKEYKEKRGFYLDISDVPGQIVEDGSKLKAAVFATLEGNQADKRLRFVQKYLSACDGRATERIAEYIGRR